MKVKIFEINDEQFSQVYLNREEYENFAILNKKEELKKNNSNVAIFVNGTNNTIKTIKEILNYEKNSSNGLNLR